MANLLDLFNYNVRKCYKKMNLVSLNTSRNLDESLPGIEWEDFEVGVQLVQEYVFNIISELDKDAFSDELRHYLYNSKLQKNIATFSLCSPDSMRFLTHEIHGGDPSKVDLHEKINREDIVKVGIATDFSIGGRLGVDLAYESDDYLIDKMYSITESLQPLVHECNPLRLQYCMSYCGRFTRLVHLFEDYFAGLARETNSVTAIILALSCFWIRRNISFELDEMNGLMQAMVRSPLMFGTEFEKEVESELFKFNKSHKSNVSVDQIKSEILDWIK